MKTYGKHYDVTINHRFYREVEAESAEEAEDLLNKGDTTAGVRETENPFKREIMNEVWFDEAEEVSSERPPHLDAGVRSKVEDLVVQREVESLKGDPDALAAAIHSGVTPVAELSDPDLVGAFYFNEFHKAHSELAAQIPEALQPEAHRGG